MRSGELNVADPLDGVCLDGFLLKAGDWLFPIVHPFNNVLRDPDTGVAFTLNRFEALRALTNLPVLVKETGWPTCGHAAATEVNQERYFVGLGETAVPFSYFEAFDQVFKEDFPLAWEPCWGLFGADRAPGRYVAGQRP